MKRLKYILPTLLLAVLLAFQVLAHAPEITGYAAVRTETPVGLRIKAVIDTETASADGTKEYGFIATRKVFLTGHDLENDDLTLDCGIYYTKGVSKGNVGGENVDLFFDKTDTQVFFAGYIHGITPYFYTDIIVVRPYAVFTDGPVYGTPMEFSLYETAKDVYNDKNVYDTLSPEQQEVIYSIITAVDGEPYEMNSKDFRIVLSTTVVKNENPTYSVSYDLYNPFTGEVEKRVIGRKKSKNYDEMTSMLLTAGKVVPVYDGVVQDTTDGYVVCDYSEAEPVWISECDMTDGKISLVSVDGTLKCKACVKEYIEGAEKVTASLCLDTAVSVFDGDFENGSFILSDTEKLSSKDTTLLCYNTAAGNTVYSDYVKAYALIDGGVCGYVIAVVNDKENSALDEKCLKHTYFNVDFYADGELYESLSVIYGDTPEPPKSPEKEGYTFIGWSESENGNAVSPETVSVTQNMSYYAVFEINEYTVSFYVDGELYKSIPVIYGQSITSPESPEIHGRSFIGWTTTEGGTAEDVIDVSALKVMGDISIYAVFEVFQNDPNLIEILTRGQTQLKKIRITQDTKNDIARDLLVECITYVLEDANNGIYIDKDYIYNTYTDLARQIKVVIKDEMTDEERSAFVNLLTNTRNIDEDVQDFLIEYFDIDLSAI